MKRSLVTLCALGTFCGILGLGALSRNYTEYEGKTVISAIRPVGVMGRLNYYNYDSYEIVEISMFLKLSSYLYSDGFFANKDGKVDTISQSGFKTLRTLSRPQDYNDFKEVFDNADIILKKTRERFNPKAEKSNQ